MLKRTKLIYLYILSILIVCVAVSFTADKIRQENTPPVVKIISPKNEGAFIFDTQLNYEISVADKEDGNTKYDEINPKEVFLEVRYVANKAKLQALLSKGIQPDPPGFAVLRASNCFNCHNFNSKAMGPSFKEIAAKYPVTAANMELLVKHIREGSSDIWGKDVMPAHPELSAGEANSIVQWMFKNAVNPDMSYYAGTTGPFRTRLPDAGKKGVYVLTASYVDHGLKTISGKQLKGVDMVVLR